MNTQTHMGEKGCTDSTQAVDHTVGLTLKSNMDDLYTEWTAKNHDKMDSLTASDRRVLITFWGGQAWEDMCRVNPELFHVAALRTGCLMTLDGSGDDEIRIQGIDKYEFMDSKANEGECSASSDVVDGSETDEMAKTGKFESPKGVKSSHGQASMPQRKAESDECDSEN